jgi:hypothetical protein
LDRKSSKFCNDEGAEVDDKLRFDMYLDFLKSSEEKPKDDDGSNEDGGGKKAKGNNGRPVSLLPGLLTKYYANVELLDYSGIDHRQIIQSLLEAA